MQLLRCKVAGHFVLQNSDWFTIHAKRTTITGPAGSGKSTLLSALRSINPPFCHPDPAPFTAFPDFVASGHQARRVIPAKKTAAIGVFICDNTLRNTLAAIDPLFMDTDHIEVGRRLDNSRWITYVEIAASSRWSELTPVLKKLREALPESGDDREVAGLWQEGESREPAERIKEELAARLNALLDRLAERAGWPEARDLLQQARFIVNRADRFKKAREVTSRSLPVFLYLHKDNLLSATIDVDRLAERLRQEGENFQQCPDLFFLKLLGIEPDFLRQAADHEISGLLRQDGRRYEAAARKLGERLGAYLPGTIPELSLSGAGGTFMIRARNSRGDHAPAAISGHQRWMLSCAVSTWYFSERQERQPIFLLDEPDAGLGREEKRELETMLGRLSDSCQVVVCASGEDFLADASGRRYRLRQEEGGGVFLLQPKEKKECGKAGVPRGSNLFF